MTVMSSANGLGARPTQVSSMPTEKKGEAEDARAADALTDQLHQLYDSIAQEPIPENLLDLLRKMES
jgi:hypothetical protein